MSMTGTGGASGSGAMEGRGKVAFDPRDFDNGNEERSAPRLTIMEEVLLLGLKDKAVSPPLFFSWERDPSRPTALRWDGVEQPREQNVPGIKLS